MCIRYSLITIMCLNICLSAQAIVQGVVKDAESGEPLSAANIEVLDTYRGTITNFEGAFKLELQRLPARLRISFIGYQPQIIFINEQPEKQMDIRLKPTILEMSSIIVTDEDPAVEIMRKVIHKKQEWQPKLKTYKAEVYCRASFSNDSGIVLIRENISDAFWSQEKGTHSIVKSMRQTADTGSDFSPNIKRLPNFYHNHVEVANFKVISVVHPDALDYYRFILIGERKMDEQIIFDISVEPKTKLQPVFVGSISVVDQEFALIGLELKMADHIIYPKPIQDPVFCFKQQFSNFGKEFWLPVSCIRWGEGSIAIPGVSFPRIKFKDIYEIRDYAVNIDIPDSLFKNDSNVTLDSIAILGKSAFSKNNIVVPLTVEEQRAYTIADTVFSFVKAFKPSGLLGWLIRKAAEEEEAEESGKIQKKKSKYSLEPQVWYNRVDGLHLAANNIYELSKYSQAGILAGYNFASKKISYGAHLKYNAFRLEYLNSSDSRYHTELYPKVVTSLIPLIGYADYFDYYWNKRIMLQYEKRFEDLNTLFRISLKNETHTSLKKETDYNLFKRNYIQPLNPPIDDGTLRSVDVRLQYGDDFLLFGFLGQKRCVLSIEFSSKNIFASDFDFSRYDLILDWRFETFMQRRAFPNTLDLRLVAGASSGKAPIQRFGALDASLGAFSTFGAFKTLYNRPYEGEEYLGLFWEHNFGTVPFEITGLDFLAQSGLEIIVHGASGRTWIDKERLDNLNYSPIYTNQFHHELGISLNKLFYFFRFDFTHRLDKKAFFIGTSVIRFK